MEAADPVWRNWAGNQTCRPTRVHRARDVDDLCDLVATAAGRGQVVRVVGAGHSFTPLVCTDDVMVDVALLSGVVDVDRARARAVVWAGTTIRELGEPLWSAGLSLRNQGDIDAQTVGGAVATATHGSGLAFTSFSGAVCGIEYVSASGSVCRVDEATEGFDAFRTSLGALGIFTEVELAVAPAYHLRETIQYWPLAEVLERWSHETSTRRHFSFFWGPRPGSLELYGFPSAPASMQEGCYVKLYDEVDATPVLRRGERVARAYEVFPSQFDMEFYELEYFVPFSDALSAVDAVRAVLRGHVDQTFPLEVRTIAAESGWMSPMYGTDSISISVSGTPGTDYWPFLRAVDDALRAFGGTSPLGQAAPSRP